MRAWGIDPEKVGRAAHRSIWMTWGRIKDNRAPSPLTQKSLPCASKVALLVSTSGGSADDADALDEVDRDDVAH